MKNYKTLASLNMIIVSFLMVVLAALMILLPFGAQWYAETKNRSAELATVIMLTCYPCSPLAAYSLYSMFVLMKNILHDDFFSKRNMRALSAISICCLIAGVVMVIAGTQYMPFYIAGGAALFCATVISVIKCVLLAVKSKFEPTDNEHAKDALAEDIKENEE